MKTLILHLYLTLSSFSTVHSFQLIPYSSCPCPTAPFFRLYILYTSSSTLSVPLLYPPLFLQHIYFACLAVPFQQHSQKFNILNFSHCPAASTLPSYTSSDSSPLWPQLTLFHNLRHHLTLPASSNCTSPTVITSNMVVQYTGSRRRGAYTYRTMKDIMNKLGHVIHGTVTGYSDEDTAGGTNHLGSGLWWWANTKQLPNSATETNECTHAFRKWLEQHIMNIVTEVHFRIGAQNVVRLPQHKARRIAAHAFQFKTQKTMWNLFKYTSGITTFMKWMVVETADALLSGAVHFRLYLPNLSHVILCHFYS